jgi:UDPglucose 6-dehydrogenase
MRDITVVGAGYVGMANATMLGQQNVVKILELDKEKVELINNKVSPIIDPEISDMLKSVGLVATTSADEAYTDQPEIVLIATPTDYDPESDSFNTKSVEYVIGDVVRRNFKPTIIIKSTIPVGFVDEMREKYQYENIIFSPEFLREGRALRDALRPTRIVIGDKTDEAEEFANVLKECIIPNFPEAPVIYTGTKEAEAIKLFANGYLAMRVAFFNELDMYAERFGLSPRDIIEGVGYDERIGRHYNNPSFGYGGYCFPKDTKQLKALYTKGNIPNNIISSIVDSNDTRMDWVTRRVLYKRPKTVGIYRLIMKSGSDNFRSSAIQGVIERLKKRTNVIIYEPEFCDFTTKIMDCDLVHNINEFKRKSDVIITNRMESELLDVYDKVYTRDVFNNN